MHTGVHFARRGLASVITIGAVVAGLSAMPAGAADQREALRWLTPHDAPATTPGVQPGSTLLDLTPDGSRALVQSTVDDLVANDGNGRPDVFVVDVATGEVRLASFGPDGTATGGQAFGFTDDGGSVVVFHPSFIEPRIVDVDAQTSVVPAGSPAYIDLSADGTTALLGFSDAIYLEDLATGVRTFVGVPGLEERPRLAADGSAVLLWREEALVRWSAGSETVLGDATSSPSANGALDAIVYSTVVDGQPTRWLWRDGVSTPIEPAWSSDERVSITPDGSALVLAGTRADGTAGILRRDLSTGAETLLADLPAGSGQPYFTTDASGWSVAFEPSLGPGQLNVFFARGGQTRLVCCDGPRQYPNATALLLSADGSTLVTSLANRVLVDDPDDWPEVFAWDTAGSTIPDAQIADAATVEGVPGTLEITLSAPAGPDGVVLSVVLPDESDLAVPDQAVVPPGATSVAVPYDAADDGVAEGQEVVFVGISSDDAEVTKAFARVTIDDPGPVLAIDDVAGDEGTVQNVRVHVSTPLERDLVVELVELHDETTAGDWNLLDPIVVVPAGSTEAFANVELYTDENVEPVERGSVRVWRADGVLVADDAADVVITDVEPAPSLRMDPVVLTEGERATTLLRLSRPLDADVEVHLSAGGGDAGPDDWRLLDEVVVLPAGTTEVPVVVEAFADALVEPDESADLDLSTLSQVWVHRSSVTILDGPLLTVSVGDRSRPEWNSDQWWSFPVTLSASSRSGVVVSFRTSDGTATAGSDYRAKTGTITIEPGATSSTIDIRVFGDPLPEPDETFTVALTGATSVALGDAEAVGTIRDDDRPRIPRVV